MFFPAALSSNAYLNHPIVSTYLLSCYCYNLSISPSSMQSNQFIPVIQKKCGFCADFLISICINNFSAFLFILLCHHMKLFDGLASGCVPACSWQTSSTSCHLPCAAEQPLGNELPRGQMIIYFIVFGVWSGQIPTGRHCKCAWSSRKTQQRLE